MKAFWPSSCTSNVRHTNGKKQLDPHLPSCQQLERLVRHQDGDIRLCFCLALVYSTKSFQVDSPDTLFTAVVLQPQLEDTIRLNDAAVSIVKSDYENR